MVQRLAHTLLGLLLVGVSSSQLAEHECGTVASRWNETNLREVVKSWKFDEEAQAKLKELGDALGDLDHWKNDPFEVVRFLVDVEWNVTRTEENFRKMVQWRLDMDIDTFMDRYKEPAAIFHYSPVYVLRGLDREGDPIFVHSYGKLDIWGLYQRVGPEAMLDANLFLTELISTRSEGIPNKFNWQQNYYEPLTGHRLRQFTNIVDLHGLSASHVRPALLNLLKRSAHMGQDMYPGLGKRVLIIRAPKVFRMAWSVAKHFYDERVHRKFIFVSEDNYLDVLQEYVDLEHLPAAIDPVRGKGQPMPGYFEHIHMEGGEIPR